MIINILELSVYNRISAGEVVERPLSVVKELVENAIDAGANTIQIKIEEGGIKRIEVDDDGIGIPKEELYKTVIPHATSKISDESELYSISTLGFRGEALASISAVSEFAIRSRYAESDVGAMLLVHGGEDVEIKDAPKNTVGTSVTVSKLFFNTPARYKFLKSKKTEEGYITTLVSEMILANPQVAITYYVDGDLVFSTKGDGLYDGICAVFSKEISSNMIPIVPDENSFIQVSGFCGRPSCTRHNREMQTIIVNGRVISDVAISASVQNAFGERLMQRKFPIFVLSVLVPFESVDVNVHPNKREVRFERPREVCGAIYNSVKKAIEDFEFNEKRRILNANEPAIPAPIAEVKPITPPFEQAENSENQEEKAKKSTPYFESVPMAVDSLEYNEHPFLSKPNKPVAVSSGKKQPPKKVSFYEQISRLGEAFSSANEHGLKICEKANDSEKDALLGGLQGMNGDRLSDNDALPGSLQEMDDDRQMRENDVLPSRFQDMNDGRQSSENDVLLGSLQEMNGNHQRMEFNAKDYLKSLGLPVIDDNAQIAVNDETGAGSDAIQDNFSINKASSDVCKTEERVVNAPICDDFGKKSYLQEVNYNSSKKEKASSDFICKDNAVIDGAFQGVKNYKLIGQAFNTYIIVESDNRLIILDQHAVHERLLYDKLVESIENGENYVQDLLIPFVYEATPMDMGELVGILPEIRKMGFDIEEFGRNSIKISAVPAILSDIDLAEFVENLLAKERTTFSISDTIKDKLAVMACKAAIKGGDMLNDDQISAFMAGLSAGNMPLMCPHGRPTYVELTKYELEKMFKRRV